MSRDREPGFGLCCMRPDCQDTACPGRGLAMLNRADGGVRLHTDFTELLEAAEPRATPPQSTWWSDIAAAAVYVIAALLLLVAGMRKAHAAPAIAGLEPSSALAALAVVLALGFAAGFLIGRVVQARKAARLRAYCRVCALLNGVQGGAGQHASSRRVRAGAVPPAPYSYSREHPERTLSALHRHVPPPSGGS